MFNFLDEICPIFNKEWSLARVGLKNFTDEFSSVVCSCATSWNYGDFCGCYEDHKISLLWKKKFQTIEIKPPVPSETTTKHPKAELKDFTITDRDSNTLHHQAKEALHVCIKDPSLNRNIGKFRIPSEFNKLLKPPRQLELPHSSTPHPRGAPSSLGLLTPKTINTSHLLDLCLQ